jgi:putative N6-adenine-specific DNA methylase
MERFEIFASAPPGLEEVLRAEAVGLDFCEVRALPGGVVFRGGWREVWRANLCLRGAGRVLARIASFRAFHLAQLDKRARKVAWSAVLSPDRPVTVEVTCRRSKIYHDRAAKQRVERAISETVGTPLSAEGLKVMVRIEDDLVTVSVDTSGAPLHKRGHGQAVVKAPIRETLAALFLRACGFDGAEPVLDPMCGSGTFVIEASEMALGLQPGRSRAFAFEAFPGFDPAAFAAMRVAPRQTDLRFVGADRDAGAIRAATANAERAGVAGATSFVRAAISDLQRPQGPPGLVMVNPPYGARIGNRKLLFALYGTLGTVLRERFGGWRVGLVTADGGLAKATGLPLRAGPPVSHGGLTVKLHQASV